MKLNGLRLRASWVAFCASLAIVGTAHAANYGMAGCGLGAMAFKDEPGKIQIVAATLNNLISPQTFAISTGSSNCYESSGSSAKLMYIENNRVALQEDVARGSGEAIDGLLVLMGCDNAGDVKTSLKKDYQSIFSSDKAQDIYQNIHAQDSVQKSCHRVG